MKGSSSQGGLGGLDAEIAELTELTESVEKLSNMRTQIASLQGAVPQNVPTELPDAENAHQWMSSLMKKNGFVDNGEGELIVNQSFVNRLLGDSPLLDEGYDVVTGMSGDTENQAIMGEWYGIGEVVLGKCATEEPIEKGFAVLADDEKILPNGRTLSPNEDAYAWALWSPTPAGITIVVRKKLANVTEKTQS